MIYGYFVGLLYVSFWIFFIGLYFYILIYTELFIIIVYPPMQEQYRE